MRRPCSSLLLSLAVLSSAAASSRAAPLTVSGPGLVPCAQGRCVDLSWNWEQQDYQAPPADEATIVLPIPDPAEWILSSGSIRSGGPASFYGYFHPEDFYRFDGAAGSASVYYQTFGTDGTLLTENSGGLSAFCPGPDDRTDPMRCGDGNGLFPTSDYYYPTVDDASVQGLLTLRYDFNVIWDIEPISQGYNPAWSGSIHLVYSAIPEPSTGLLVIAGLLGLGIRRRVSV
jgi:hypothetical protein